MLFDGFSPESFIMFMIPESLIAKAFPIRKRLLIGKVSDCENF